MAPVNRHQVAYSGVDYQVQVSTAMEDAKWDEFVAQTPGGHHVQTSLWGQVKEVLGWSVSRVVVTEHDQVVAGGQLLMRSMPVLGSVAYVTKGPLCTSDDLALAELVVNELRLAARRYGARYLVVQPPNCGEVIASHLPGWGFQPSWVELAPTATVLIDVSADLDDILGQMKRQTRQNIRRSERSGIRIREGADAAVHAFYCLHLATSQRQGFSPYPEKYFARMWQVLGPAGYVKLLLASRDAEIVSALLIVPFGDTVIAKVLGWSGSHGECRPNEALFWAAIEWTRSHGYHYFDFEGIDPSGARALLRGEALPESLHRTPTFFKLGFGGRVILYPEPYDYVYNPMLRWAYNKVSPRLEDWSALYARLLDYVRRH